MAKYRSKPQSAGKTMKKNITIIGFLIVLGVAVFFVMQRETQVETLSGKIASIDHLWAKRNAGGYSDKIIENGDRVDVYFGYGGFFEDYALVAAEAAEKGISIRIVKDCASACPHMLEEARKKSVPVCLDPKARLRFHRGTNGAQFIPIEKYYSPELVTLVNAKGGHRDSLDWPIGANFTDLTAAEVEDIFPICGA